MHYDFARPLRRFRAVNENASSFVAKASTVTEPSGNGASATGAAVLNLTENGSLIAKRIKLCPILLGSDNDVSSFRFIGWHKTLLDGKLTLWTPFVLGEFSCTASASVGVAGAAVLDTERFCDTITPVALLTRDQKIAAGTSTGSEYEIMSPANDMPGHIIMPLIGIEKLEVVTDQTTNTATANCLYAFV